MTRWDVGIDLGTEFVRAAEQKSGPVLDVPAAMAFRAGKRAPICAGDIARQLEGRACEGVSIHYPLKDGVLENTFYAERLFHWVYRQLDSVNMQRRFDAAVTCAPFARPVQREALLEAAATAGATETMLVRSDAAAAVGAGLDILAPEAGLLVDIGAGKVTATLFTYGRVASFGYLPYGMSRIDDQVQRILRTEFGYRVSRAAAVEIKHTLGSAMPDKAPKDVIMHAVGISTAERMPTHFDVETQPVLDACEAVVSEIARLCAIVVDGVPEELSADLNDTGAVLAGGGANLVQLDRRIGQALGIPCRVADNPETCAIRGLAKILEAPDDYGTMLQTRRESAAWS